MEQCRAGRGRLPAEPPRAGGSTLYFAAIAVGDDYGWGEAFGFESREEAESIALANCRRNAANCAVKVWSNDCIALARGMQGAAGWAWGVTLREAVSKALQGCEAHDPCCRVTRSYCADEIAR